jgi:LuxR family maltose regulon positive regulatory protein
MVEKFGTSFPQSTPNGDPIMTVKLEPPALPPWRVARERLRERLSAGATRPLTMVTGPAGSGKTTLVADWVEDGRPPGQVAWLSLEPADDQPAVFWSYVLAALHRAGIDLAVDRGPSAADCLDRSFLVRLAVGLAARPYPVVLVLDDVQVLTRRSILDALGFLIEHAGNRLRIVLLTRTEPALPLHRYRVTGSVTEIGRQSLAFTAEEATSLLTAHGVRLEESEVADLVERTEGWAVALRLHARALPGAAIGETPAELVEYIRHEVLAGQHAAGRDFLRRISVADSLPAGLAAELTGRRDAEQTLDRLTHDGVLRAPEPGGEPGRRHHPIVREVLFGELTENYPGHVVGLHRRAARWYTEQGLHADALSHAVAAGDWVQGAATVVGSLTIADLLIGARAERCAEVLRRIPAGDGTAEVAIVLAAVAVRGADEEVCAKHLARAHEIVGGSLGAQRPALSLSLLAVELTWAGMADPPDRLAVVADQAGRLLDDVLARGIDVPASLRMLIRLAHGNSLLLRNDVEAARTSLLSAAEDAAAGRLERERGVILGRLALAEALSGRLRRASDHARQALTAPPAVDAVSVAPYLALAWVYAEEYDLAEARAHADRAAAVLTGQTDPLATGLLCLIRARIHRARGDVARAATVLAQELGADPAPRPPWLTEVLTLAYTTLQTPGRPPEPTGPVATSRHLLAEATAALAAGDTRTARQAAAVLTERSGLPLDVRVDGWLVTANSELADGRRDQARQALERALAMAESERLRRPVLEAAPPLRRLLREERDIGARHSWLDVTTPSYDEPPVDAHPVVVESLTAKEAEVLRYLSDLLTTDEIARAMFVSVNTVKTHVRGVLRKLAATRRNEAVRRARYLGLI